MRDPTRDSFVHLLAEYHAIELATLAGVKVTGPLLRLDSKLPAEILVADCVWAMLHDLVHVELESHLHPDAGWRLMEYRSRIRMRTAHHGRRLHQHILVLGTGSPPNMPRCRQPSIDVIHRDHDDATLHYQVTLLRNIAPDQLLTNPATAVFAPLGHCPNRHRLSIVRHAITTIRDSGLDPPGIQRLAHCLKGFAGFRINDTATLNTILHQELNMAINWKDSSTVGPLLTEAEQRGEARGEARGQAEGEARGRAQGEAAGRVLGLLNALYGPDPRITTNLAEQLLNHPNLEQQARQTPTLDQLLHNILPGS